MIYLHLYADLYIAIHVERFFAEMRISIHSDPKHLLCFSTKGFAQLFP